MNIEWEDGFIIHVSVDAQGDAVIAANREGLLSLAKQLMVLADETDGAHIHYDGYNSLEQGSREMIIQKLP